MIIVLAEKSSGEREGRQASLRINAKSVKWLNLYYKSSNLFFTIISLFSSEFVGSARAKARGDARALPRTERAQNEKGFTFSRRFLPVEVASLAKKVMLGI
jgi:hypothetical protein